MVTEVQPVNRLTDMSRYGDRVQRLPYWARSTNPIVRRHLGLYWRTVPPDTRPFFIIYLVWVCVMLLGLLMPQFFSLTMLSFLASIMIIPVMMVIYAHVLLTIAINAARNMQMEMQNETLQLLQATPMNLPQIFLGKVAAAFWRRMDDVVMVAQSAMAFGPPLIFTGYTLFWPLEASVWQAPIITLVATLVTVFRIIAEPIMVGAISVFVGLVVPGRSRAITSAVALSAFYFLLLNLAANLPAVRGTELADGTLIPPNHGLIIAFDLVLPVLLPLVITYGLLKLAARIATSD